MNRRVNRIRAALARTKWKGTVEVAEETSPTLPGRGRRPKGAPKASFSALIEGAGAPRRKR
jgi:hypothetical protein